MLGSSVAAGHEHTVGQKSVVSRFAAGSEVISDAVVVSVSSTASPEWSVSAGGTAAKKQESVIQQAMDGDPDDAFTKALRSRYNDLEAQRAELAAKLSGADETVSPGPRLPTADDLSLLDELPYLAVNLAKAPEALLRTLFEVVQLGVQVHGGGEHATLTITLPADQVSEVAGAAERISDQMNPQAMPGQSAKAACGVVERAPGEIRTHTGRVLNPLPLPVGLRGRGMVTLRDHPAQPVVGSR